MSGWCKYAWLMLLMAGALVTAVWPQLDVLTTRLFYDETQGFPWRAAGITNLIHDLATGWLPKLLAIGLGAAVLLALLRRRAGRPWLFLLLVLLLGPGLLANLVLKDQWGRARPVQVTEFGGTAAFTPYWQPAQACDKNCSFISGDGAFGFAFVALALVLRRRRLAFWSGTAIGIVFGMTRIMMGAHFLSDTLWAALLMLAVSLGLYACLYGRDAAVTAWRSL